TPGMCNTTASGPGSASRNGSTSSMFAPMPLKSRSGVLIDPSPGRTPTRSVCPSTSRKAMEIRCIDGSPTTRFAAGPSFLHHVESGRIAERPVVETAERRGACDECARALLDPREPVRPPAPVVLRGFLQPLSSAFLACRPYTELRLRISGWIDQRLDVSAVGKDEAAARPEELRRTVAPLPRRDVIGGARDDIRFEVHLSHVER